MHRNDETDVLIVGAGASGMLAATCAAAYGMNVRIIDKRPQPLGAGHADGINTRTLEMLDTFGLADELVRAGANRMGVMNLWSAEGDELKRIRSTRTSHRDPRSPWTTHTLSQAKIARVLENFISARSSIRVERGVISENLEVDEGREYPVKLAVRTVSDKDCSVRVTEATNNIRLDDDAELLADSIQANNHREEIRAKYVVACDGELPLVPTLAITSNQMSASGAHSWVRKKLGIPMLGDTTDIVWGVVDILPITDFPTPRTSNIIARKGQGIQWIPREGGLVRIYCVLGNAKSDEDGRLIRSSVTFETIMAEVRAQLSPYKLDYDRCEWWAAYQVGQRVAGDNGDPTSRIFLAGDAVHTHSPQAGQGLNVSMQDTYNLMWKLNLVLKGAAKPTLLQTYRDERLQVGQALVDFDRMWAAAVAGRDPPPTAAGTFSSKIVLTKVHQAAGPIFWSLSVLYPPSLLTSSDPQVAIDAKAHLDEGRMPPGIVTGMRMPPCLVERHCSSEPMLLHKAFIADGRFRFLVFPGDISQPKQMQRLEETARQIESLELRPLIDVLTIHSADPFHVNQLDLPSLCNPFRPETGYDYYKIFYDASIIEGRSNEVSVYQSYGINPENGRVVLLRPDCYVAYQGDLDDFEPIHEYFKDFVLRK